MRAWIVMAGLFAAAAFAQRGPAFGVAPPPVPGVAPLPGGGSSPSPARGIAPPAYRPPGPAAPGARPGPRMRGVRPGGWAGGGGLWWGGPETLAVREQPVEFVAPNAIHNQNYQPDRLKPETREFPEGSLPAPSFARQPETLPARGCRVVFQDGSAEPAQGCRLEADLVVYESARGVRKRVSVELVDLPKSSL